MKNLCYKQLTNNPACAIIMTTESCNSFTVIIFDTLDNSFKGYYSVFCVLKNVHDFENEEKIRKTEGIYVQMLKMRRNI